MLARSRPSVDVRLLAVTDTSTNLQEDGRRLVVSVDAFRTVATAALVVVSIVIITGAAVRLTGSGMGCETWPRCTGDNFISFRDPNQTIEQTNRLFSGLASIAVAVLAVFAARARIPYRSDLFRWSLALVVGVLGQMPLGGITVLTHLHPASVAAHFVLSMLLLVAAIVLVWRSRHGTQPPTALVDRADIIASRVAVCLAALLMLTGPALTGTGPNAGGAQARRFGWFIPDVTRVHSVNMWVFLLVVLSLSVHLARSGAPEGVTRRARNLLVVVVAQGSIGYAQYWMGIPPLLVVAHIAGAVAVVTATVWFHLGLFDTGIEEISPISRPTTVTS